MIYASLVLSLIGCQEAAVSPSMVDEPSQSDFENLISLRPKAD